MSTNTSIEWATKTWGPVLGCKKVSAGCDRCYAIRTAHRLAGNPNPKVSTAYAELTQRTDDGVDWTGVVRTLPGRLLDPMGWRKPERIFVNSQSDLFHPAVGADFTARVFATMAATARHTYQILTKRPIVAARMLRNPAFWAQVERHAWEIGPAGTPFRIESPLPNVWLGVSVEDQAAANDRIPKLLQIPSAVRWISAEPLLGPIDLTRLPWLKHGTVLDVVGGKYGEPGVWKAKAERLDWVVIGGESGPGARPMHPDWARSLRDQCSATGVPILFKQWGEWGPAPWSVPVCDPAVGWHGTDEELAAAKADSEARGATHAYSVDAHRYDWELYQPSYKPWSLERQPGPLTGGQAAMRRWGKKLAGRELDGVVHDAYPEPRTAVAS